MRISLRSLAAVLAVALPLSAITVSAETATTRPAKAEKAEKAKEAEKPKKDMMHPVVVMKTSMGTIKIRLDREKAPITVENFLGYVADKFYDGTIFHRVINNFMIQGGGFTRDMEQKSTQAGIENEAQNGLKNVRGSIAMARTSDPNSATAQFFINVVDNPNLDYPKPDGHGYAVFGQVIEGMDVVDKIKAVKTSTQGRMQNVPVEPVIIESVSVEG